MLTEKNRLEVAILVLFAPGAETVHLSPNTWTTYFFVLKRTFQRCGDSVWLLYFLYYDVIC